MELNLDLDPDLFERLAVFVPCNPWCLVGLLILNLFIRKFFGNSLVTPYYNGCHRLVPTIYVVLTTYKSLSVLCTVLGVFFVNSQVPRPDSLGETYMRFVFIQRH